MEFSHTDQVIRRCGCAERRDAPNGGSMVGRGKVGTSVWPCVFNRAGVAHWEKPQVLLRPTTKGRHQNGTGRYPRQKNALQTVCWPRHPLWTISSVHFARSTWSLHLTPQHGRVEQCLHSRSSGLLCSDHCNSNAHNLGSDHPLVPIQNGVHERAFVAWRRKTYLLRHSGQLFNCIAEYSWFIRLVFKWCNCHTNTTWHDKLLLNKMHHWKLLTISKLQSFSNSQKALEESLGKKIVRTFNTFESNCVNKASWHPFPPTIFDDVHCGSVNVRTKLSARELPMSYSFSSGTDSWTGTGLPPSCLFEMNGHQLIEFICHITRVQHLESAKYLSVFSGSFHSFSNHYFSALVSELRSWNFFTCLYTNSAIP